MNLGAYYRLHLEGIDRGTCFQTLEEEIEMTPPVDFARYLEELQSLPTIDVLQRAGVPPTDYDDAQENTVVGARPPGDTRYPYTQLQIDWFNYRMKGEKNDVLQRDSIHYFVMGSNEWRATNVWPPEGTGEMKWYLSGSGNANTRNGNSVLTLQKPTTRVVNKINYDPSDPVPSLGGHTCCAGTDTEAGSYDQRGIERREDVLVYTSEVLGEDLDVVGRIRAELLVSSSAVDTDFTVKLVDVYPDGTAYNVIHFIAGQEWAIIRFFRGE